jgi:hypothetical protein
MEYHRHIFAVEMTLSAFAPAKNRSLPDKKCDLNNAKSQSLAIFDAGN